MIKHKFHGKLKINMKMNLMLLWMEKHYHLFSKIKKNI